MIGKVVETINTTEELIEYSNSTLSKGIYLLAVTNADKKETIKVVIE